MYIVHARGVAYVYFPFSGGENPTFRSARSPPRFNVLEGLVLSAHPLLTLRGDPMGEPQGRVYRGTFCTGHVPMVGTTSIQVSLVDTISASQPALNVPATSGSTHAHHEWTPARAQHAHTA